MQISDQILSMRDDCIKIRRDLHRIPEIGFELHKTHEYIRPILEDWPTVPVRLTMNIA